MKAIDALRAHWPEYLMEAAALGTLMVSACGFGAALPRVFGGDFARRLAGGIAMGLTAVSIICSPWGKRPGAHMNPALTLSFWWPGRSRRGRGLERASGKPSPSATRMATPSRSWSNSFRRFANKETTKLKPLNRVLSAFASLALLFAVHSYAAKMDVHTSGKFEGPKANDGSVIHYVENGKSMLKVSDDFNAPEKREVVVPAYVKDIVKVQAYCAWTEVVLGETSFSSVIK